MPHDPQTGLPFAAGSHESYQAARIASLTRAEKTSAYLRLLHARGPLTDDEVSRITYWPRSSVCSIRAGAVACNLVEKGFTHRISHDGHACRTWTLTRSGSAAVQAMKESV